MMHLEVRRQILLVRYLFRNIIINATSAQIILFLMKLQEKCCSEKSQKTKKKGCHFLRMIKNERTKYVYRIITVTSRAWTTLILFVQNILRAYILWRGNTVCCSIRHCWRAKGPVTRMML